MPTLTQLEYAVAVDTHRHFGKAAKACHVSQPTLSTQLAKLEDEIGATLFDRTRQPVLPTPEGLRLLAQARIVVAELRRFETLARDDDEDISGPFRLGVIPTVSPYLLPLFLGLFLERHPRLELTVEEMPTAALLSALERESLDAGLMATPIEGNGFDVHVLYEEPFYLYASAEHPLAHKAFVSDRDIPVTDLWLLSDGHCMRGQVLQLCGVRRPPAGSKALAPKTCALPVRFESGNLETLARLVESGLGLTLLPYLSVMPHLTRGKGTKARVGGVVVPFRDPVPAREISLVTYRKHATRRVRDALAAAIVESLPKALRTRETGNVRIVPLAMDRPGA